MHRQRTVGRHIRGLDEETLPHLDRVLLPILQRLTRARLPEAGPVLPGLWQAVAQGRVRKLLWHLVARWNDLVRSPRNPDIPASTNRLEGWFGRPGPGPA